MQRLVMVVLIWFSLIELPNGQVYRVGEGAKYDSVSAAVFSLCRGEARVVGLEGGGRYFVECEPK